MSKTPPKAKRGPAAHAPLRVTSPITVDELRERVIMAGAHLHNASEAFSRYARAHAATGDAAIVQREIAAAGTHVRAAIEIARVMSGKRRGRTGGAGRR